jgi:hypothetical protein
MGGVLGTMAPRLLTDRTNARNSNSVRFPGKVTPRPRLSFVTPAPTPKSFSDIFTKTKAPLVLQRDPWEGGNNLKKETTTKATALATLRALLDHVKGKESRDYQEYEYYDDTDYEYVERVKQKTAKKPRPKIVPKQRVVNKSKSKQKLQRENHKFSSFVTQKPKTIGEILGTVQERPQTR